MVYVLVDQALADQDVPHTVHAQLNDLVLESVAVAMYMQLHAGHTIPHGDASQVLNVQHAVSVTGSTSRLVGGAIGYVAIEVTVEGQLLHVLDALRWNVPVRRLLFHNALEASYGFVENRSDARWHAYTDLRANSVEFEDAVKTLFVSEGMTADAMQAAAYINAHVPGMFDMSGL